MLLLPGPQASSAPAGHVLGGVAGLARSPLSVATPHGGMRNDRLSQIGLISKGPQRIFQVQSGEKER